MFSMSLVMLQSYLIDVQVHSYKRVLLLYIFELLLQYKFLKLLVTLLAIIYIVSNFWDTSL